MNSNGRGGIKHRYRGRKYRHDLHHLYIAAAIGPDGTIYPLDIPDSLWGKYWIEVYQYENTRVPHVHFTPYSLEERDGLKRYRGLNMAHGKAKHSDQANWLEGSILLLEPKYFLHDRKDRTLNTVKERDNFADFFKADSNMVDDELGRFLTWWEVLVIEWNIERDGEGIKVKYDSQGRAIQPDYSLLPVEEPKF